MPKKSAIYSEVKNGATGALVPIEAPALSAITNQKASYPPERLDDVVEKLVQNAEMCTTMMLRYTPILAVLLQKLQTEMAQLVQRLEAQDIASDEQTGVPEGFREAVGLADRISVILMRMNAMTHNAVKSKDEATRLQVFLKPEESTVGDLAHLSENELRKIVAQATTGWVTPDENV